MGSKHLAVWSKYGPVRVSPVSGRACVTARVCPTFVCRIAISVCFYKVARTASFLGKCTNSLYE